MPRRSAVQTCCHDGTWHDLMIPDVGSARPTVRPPLAQCDRADRCARRADGRLRGRLRAGAGLNSTPALISMIVSVIFSKALHVSHTRSNRQRGKNGQVSNMKSTKVKVSGRGWAAPLAPVCAASAALAGFSRGSG